MPSRFKINFISFLTLNFDDKFNESIGKVGLKFSDRNLRSGHFKNVIFKFKISFKSRILGHFIKGL
ncbi:hypothetical protein H740_01273 [Campylobacter showae CC57C]|uniref:Uncharacterized protein n=1 Tax=Campylobacter showae CC57C TaxID=1073353 RepID=M3JFH9_9BACT|nr:hypothetical protein H740_01273 [Campylobacter showae CC57C]